MAKNIDRFLRTSAAHLGLHTPQEDGREQARDTNQLVAGVRLPAAVNAQCAAPGLRRQAHAMNACVRC